MAVEITCELEGLEEFEAAMQKLDSAIHRQVYEQLERWAMDVREYAKASVPVRTGHLQSSIYAKVQEWFAEIGAEATYAMFVEFGTRYMKARPFLFPAVEEYLPELERIILEAIDQAKTESGLE